LFFKVTVSRLKAKSLDWSQYIKKIIDCQAKNRKILKITHPGKICPGVKNLQKAAPLVINLTLSVLVEGESRKPELTKIAIITY
jgi:hypothetical protein